MRKPVLGSSLGHRHSSFDGSRALPALDGQLTSEALMPFQLAHQLMLGAIQAI